MLLLISGSLLFSNKKIDLTKDKKFTLSDNYKAFLNQITQNVTIEVYLGGSLPNILQHFRERVKDVIRNFHSYQSNITYKIVDFDLLADEDRETFLYEVKKKNIQPTTLQIKKNSRTIERMIYPVATIKCNNKTTIIPLLESRELSDLATMVKESIDNIEYKLLSTLEKITSQPKRILILQSHGSPEQEQFRDLKDVIDEKYCAEFFCLDSDSNISPSDISGIVIASPRNHFSDEELYILDQYLMRGGSLIFFLDGLDINLEELHRGKNFAFPSETGLEIFLEKYGFKLHANIIQDIQCSKYPFIVGSIGNKPNITLTSWTFFPLITHFANHKIMKDISTLYCQFSSAVSAEESPDTNAIGLLYTSENSSATMAPIFINIDSLGREPDPSYYKESYIPIAGFLEGKFDSAFKNELILPTNSNDKFIKKSSSAKIFLAGSSSLVMNQYNKFSKKIIPLGYDPFSKKKYSNREFLRNVIDYMCSNSKIIPKSRESKIYLLNNLVIQKFENIIQSVAILWGLIVIVIVGLILRLNHKKRYEKY